MGSKNLNTVIRPKVLLLGNGINRAFSDESVSWSKLLDKITTNKAVGKELNKLSDEKKKKGVKANIIPFPLEVVIRTDDNVSAAMSRLKTDESVKRLMYGGINNDMADILHKILSMNFDYILTTNYSYEIEMSVIGGDLKSIDKKLKRMQHHTEETARAEAKFLLHTYNSVIYNETTNQIWHIHGEARKPDSMIIGHYYYGNILFKYKELLDKRRSKYKHSQDNGEKFPIKSWLDAFILGDVYVLGLGMDFSEMDLWWLINRKKREEATHGNVVFYEPEPDKENIKDKLLNDYEVNIRRLEPHYEADGKFDYKRFYKNALIDIENTMQINCGKGGIK